MFNSVCKLALIIIGFYWAGDMARQNPKIDLLVENLEKGYMHFNEKLKEATVTEGLEILRRFYGWASFFAFSLFFCFSLFVKNKYLLGFLPIVGIGLFFGWFSIQWCLDHKKTVREFSSNVSMMVFSPILLGVFDILSQTSITPALAEIFYSIPSPLEWNIPRLTHPIAIGGAISLMFVAFFAIYYVVTWFLAVPAAFVSAIMVLFSVALARFIHTLAPNKPLVGFTFVLFVLITYLT